MKGFVLCPCANGFTDAGLTEVMAVDFAGVRVFEINPNKF